MNEEVKEVKEVVSYEDGIKLSLNKLKDQLDDMYNREHVPNMMIKIDYRVRKDGSEIELLAVSKKHTVNVSNRDHLNISIK